MKPRVLLALLILAVGSAVGCLNTRPAVDQTRYFVLTARSTSPAPPPARETGWVVGLNPVDLAPYALNSRLVIRTSASEVLFLEEARWAERLDRGIQRVVAANLTDLPPVRRVDPAPWRRQEIDLELTLSISQFEVRRDGTAALVADWRFRFPGGSSDGTSGRAQFEKPGPLPQADPAGAVDTLSDLLAELSRRLAAELATVVVRKGN